MSRDGRFLRPLMPALLLAGLLLTLAAPARRDPGLRAAEALRVTVSDSVVTEGWFIRDERLLTAPFSAAPLLCDGEKAAAGERLAVEGGQAAAASLRQLRRQIRNMEQAMGVPFALLGTRIREQLAGCAADRSDPDLLRALILREGAGDAAAESLLAALRLQERQTEASLRGEALTAPEAGWFVSRADGYEAVLTPDRLPTLTDPALLPPDPVPETACGRLIRSPTWYLAAMLPETALPAPGSAVEVSLRGGACFTMQVEWSLPAADGECLTVLSCGSGLHRICCLRTALCTLEFRSREGLQIPAAALHKDGEGRTGVYVLAGGAARWKEVTLLRSDGEGCTVALDQSDTGMLWPGDLVLTGNDLYDGKVVYP